MQMALSDVDSTASCFPDSKTLESNNTYMGVHTHVWTMNGVLGICQRAFPWTNDDWQEAALFLLFSVLSFRNMHATRCFIYLVWHVLSMHTMCFILAWHILSTLSTTHVLVKGPWRNRTRAWPSSPCSCESLGQLEQLLVRFWEMSTGSHDLKEQQTSCTESWDGCRGV